ncbi:FHA domain-containing protein PS1 [Vicia villosa]|uniref:FHA domain-containing protein PS1 n=1 Tax=Vicia villosa TaxID=3911 RepID=UPI00273B8682|nr:FHA domain-containing protein PS1 [Vicia villosa]
MADSDENPNQQENSIIPVLTVFKNKSIIKNICIVLNNNDDTDHIILIGRHPTCNIVLTHPSISRFHLQIRFTPSSKSISLLDISSVHGTWVSGRKLEHGVSVELKGGDSFRLGVSSRVYLLRFVSQFDANALKNIGSLCFDDDEIKSQLETFDDENDSVRTETSCCDGEDELGESQICYLSPPYVQSVDKAENREQIIEACPEVEATGETNLLCTWKECFKHTLCNPVVEANKLHQQSSAEKKSIDPEASLNEIVSAAVDVKPKESDFDGAFKDSDKIEDVLTTRANIFNSEDMPDSESHQTNTDGEVSVESLSDGEGYSLNEIVKNMDPSSSDENGVAAVNVKPREHKIEFFFEENASIDNILTSVASLFVSENRSSLVEEANPVTNLQQNKIVEEVNVDSLSDGEKENKCDKVLQAYQNFKPCDEECNSLDETVEDTGKSYQTESLNPSVAQEADLDITYKENQAPQSLVAVAGCFDLESHESCVEDLAERSSTFACDKAMSAPQNQTRKSRLLNTPNVDTKFVTSNLRDISVINKPMRTDLFSVLDEEEMFTPNKENLEDSKSSKSQISKNLLKASPNFYSAERSTSSNKENLTPREAQQWQSGRKPLECHDTAGLRKKRMERTPLKSLMNSGGNHNSANSSPFYSPFSAAKENLTPIEAQQWQSEKKPLDCHDTAGLSKKRVERTPLQSLMSSGRNHNSANSSSFYSPFSAAKEIPLQSLGSSGGNFISANSSSFSSPFSAAKSILGVTARTSNSRHISDKQSEPSPINEERKRSWDMVVDTASLLNKESRKALQLLQGLKGTRLIIPQSVIRELGSLKQHIGVFRRIPEATLALEWIEECLGKTKWWIHILDCVFPIVEEHILDCALQYRKKDDAGQLVLLSDDINLKIKSMAKGLPCETAEQFRRSLVNPFSERFMWANSSPRGLTWSCQDDVVLREKYCCFPSKAGLKLLVT